MVVLVVVILVIMGVAALAYRRKPEVSEQRSYFTEVHDEHWSRTEANPDPLFTPNAYFGEEGRKVSAPEVSERDLTRA